MPVGTGVRYLYAADYTANGTTITYDEPFNVARLVSASPEIETGDDVTFYADDTQAESAGGIFTGGKLKLTVDGIADDIRVKITGAKATTVNGVTATVNTAYDEMPYLGIGYVERFMHHGKTTFVPVFFPKAQFSPEVREAKTQEDSIEFQSIGIEAVLMRDDTEDANWRYIGAGKTTAAEALKDLKALMGSKAA